MASRKGVEPLTPGLGNLCSIQLSYRDNLPRSRCLSGTRPSRTDDMLMIRLAFSDQEHRIRNPALYPAELRGLWRVLSKIRQIFKPEVGSGPQVARNWPAPITELIVVRVHRPPPSLGQLRIARSEATSARRRTKREKSFLDRPRFWSGTPFSSVTKMIMSINSII